MKEFLQLMRRFVSPYKKYIGCFAEYFICCIQCVFIHFFDSYSEYPVQDGRG